MESSDRLNIPPVKILVNDDPREPVNTMTAIETPRHLQDAANTELSRLQKSGCLEPMSHPTEWCSRTFFVQKLTKEGKEIRTRLVSNMKNVNPRLVRVANPLDGFFHILRRLEPNETLFVAIDLSSGYQQVTIHPNSRDLLVATGTPHCPRERWLVQITSI